MATTTKKTDEKEPHLYSLPPLLFTVCEPIVRACGLQQERCLSDILTHHQTEAAPARPTADAIQCITLGCRVYIVR